MSLTCAKYAMGVQAVSSQQHRADTPTSTRLAMPLESVSTEAALRLECGDAASQQQQLRQFGGMVSPHLRTAQQDFLAVVCGAIECANARRRLAASLPSSTLHAQTTESSGSNRRRQGATPLCCARCSRAGPSGRGRDCLVTCNSRGTGSTQSRDVLMRQCLGWALRTSHES